MLNSEAKEELDAFGDHLTVMVEDSIERVHEVHEITTRHVNGEIVVMIVMGDKVVPN